MSSEQPKVVYTDVDGTLVGPGGCLFRDADRKLTMEPAQTIVHALEAGIDIVMVSGRNRDQLREDARIMGFKNFIAELGAEIVYDLGKSFTVNVGDFKAKGQSVFEAIAKRGAPDLLFTYYGGRLEYHTPWSDHRDYTHLLRGRVDVDEVNKFLKIHGVTDLKFVDNGRIHVKSNTLKVAELHAYHLLPKGTDKASAIAIDMATRGIKKEEAIAVGDSEADLPLAEHVKTLYFVAGAVTEDPHLPAKLKPHPNVVVTKRDKGLGWADAVKEALKS